MNPPRCEFFSHRDRPQINKEITEEQIKLLNWVIQLTGSGLTNGMIRKACHNKIVELTGEGEKA